MNLEKMPQEQNSEEELINIVNDLQDYFKEKLGKQISAENIEKYLDIIFSGKHSDSLESAANGLKEIVDSLYEDDDIDDTINILKESPEDIKE